MKLAKNKQNIKEKEAEIQRKNKKEEKRQRKLSDDEKEEVDQTPMEAIKKSINIISGFLNRWNHGIFQDNIDDNDDTND